MVCHCNGCADAHSFPYHPYRNSVLHLSLQDVEGQGVAGDILEVRHGLARNKLIPNKWAVPATRPNIERFGRRVQVHHPSYHPILSRFTVLLTCACNPYMRFQLWSLTSLRGSGRFASHHEEMCACLQSADPSLHRKAQGTPAQNLDNEVDAVLKHLSKVPVVSFTPHDFMDRRGTTTI